MLMSDDITLNESNKGETSSPGILYSGGMGPCISIGIYDSKRKRGFMIHEANAYHHSHVSDFLDDVLKKSAVENLSVHVAGGGLDPDEEDGYENINEDIYTCRDFVSQELYKRFSDDQITIGWNDTLDMMELILETSNGCFHIERRGLEDDFLE